MGSGKSLNGEELIRRARNKDTAAIRAIYDANAQYLYAVCRRYLGNSAIASDILQDAFVKIFTSLGSFEWRGEGSLRSWMRRIVVNEALMHLRKQKHEDKTLPNEELPDRGEEPEVEGIELEMLQAMIESLSEGYRTVFNLYVFEQMSHKEIALALGISESVSYVRFSRARALLAAKIREYKKRNG